MPHSAEQPMIYSDLDLDSVFDLGKPDPETEREDLLETLAILTSKTERELTNKTTPQLKQLLQKALDNA